MLTINGYYNWVKGGSVPYAFVTGPTDYERDIQLNASNYQYFKYRGINAKLELPINDTNKLTLIGAYDNRDVNTPDADGDFTAVDLLRTSGHDDLKTRTLEARLDSELSSTLSTIFGLFYSRETRDVHQDLAFFPGVFDFVNTASSSQSERHLRCVRQHLLAAEPGLGSLRRSSLGRAEAEDDWGGRLDAFQTSSPVFLRPSFSPT